MKNRLFTCIALAFLLLAALSLSSCGNEKYNVWTDSESYSTFVSETGVSLDDGKYIRSEIKNWDEVGKSLTNEGKHRWDEANIKKWLFGIGFGEYESTKESSWLVTTDHGMIVSRTGNTVYMIIK